VALAGPLQWCGSTAELPEIALTTRRIREPFRPHRNAAYMQQQNDVMGR
jgi:hypothetical protein